MAAPWPRYEGRQALGRLMHGDNVLVGVAATKLTTTTMGITKLSVYSDDYFNDWFGRFYLGPKADTEFVITDFDQQTEPALTDGMITLKPTLSSAATAEDRFEASPDYSPAEMNDAINLAIRAVSTDSLQGKVDDTVTVVSSTTFESAVPDGFVNIHTIIQEQSTAGRFSDSLDTIDRNHWKILPGAPSKIVFDSNYVSLTAGRKLRIIGQQAPPLLKKDGELCLVDQAYVVFQAKANLHFSHVSEGGDQHEQKMIIAQTRADIERKGILVAADGERVSF